MIRRHVMQKQYKTETLACIISSYFPLINLNATLSQLYNVKTGKGILMNF